MAANTQPSISNLGKWSEWYAGLADPEPYALTPTYRLGANWLANCDQIQDWGCGKGWLRTLVAPERYLGIDGSATPFADEIADLAGYRSETPGIFMRHVLEHDLRWPQILDNAIASFTERMALILFTPLTDHTFVATWQDDPGVPDIAFALSDLTAPMDAAGVLWSAEALGTESHYGTETIIRARKS